MNDTDVILTCRDCQADFIFTADEQQYFRDKGLEHQPRRCKDCRLKRKAQKAEAATLPRVCGIVTRFDATKGYGFAIPDGYLPGERDVFVHWSQILVERNGNGNGHGKDTPYRSLTKGQRIEFQIVPGNQRKPAAVNVKVVE